MADDQNNLLRNRPSSRVEPSRQFEDDLHEADLELLIRDVLVAIEVKLLHKLPPEILDVPLHTHLSCWRIKEHSEQAGRKRQVDWRFDLSDKFEALEVSHAERFVVISIELTEKRTDLCLVVGVDQREKRVDELLWPDDRPAFNGSMPDNVSVILSFEFPLLRRI